MLLYLQATNRDEQVRIYREKVRQYSPPSTTHEGVLLRFYRKLLNDVQDEAVQKIAGH